MTLYLLSNKSLPTLRAVNNIVMTCIDDGMFEQGYRCVVLVGSEMKATHRELKHPNDDWEYQALYETL
jgi:hypothetical protein